MLWRKGKDKIIWFLGFHCLVGGSRVGFLHLEDYWIQAHRMTDWLRTLKSVSASSVCQRSSSGKKQKTYLQQNNIDRQPRCELSQFISFPFFLSLFSFSLCLFSILTFLSFFRCLAAFPLFSLSRFSLYFFESRSYLGLFTLYLRNLLEGIHKIETSDLLLIKQ